MIYDIYMHRYICMYAFIYIPIDIDIDIDIDICGNAPSKF